MKTGIDIVHIDKIKELGDAAKQRVFSPKELENSNAEHLAGIFAAKEAFFKALEMNPKWLNIEVNYKENGKPYLNLLHEYGISKMDLSISHDNDYAVASVVLLLKN